MISVFLHLSSEILPISKKCCENLYVPQAASADCLVVVFASLFACVARSFACSSIVVFGETARLYSLFVRSRATLVAFVGALRLQRSFDMEWETPRHEEIDLNCEISSYANAEL